MFSEVDSIVFPDSCEVIQISSQLFVYPIMKNGSSSFYMQLQYQQRPDWKILRNTEIVNIDFPLITFIRNPRSRFISGVNTYLQHLRRDVSFLDSKTAMWFINKYLFLDRHFCPQFFWLINLNRYCRPDTIIELKSMSDLTQYAGIDHNAGVLPADAEFYEQIKQFDWEKLELYFYLDQILYDMIGQSLTYQQILDKIKSQPRVYNLIFERTKTISCNI